jgi:PAS domain S-box-containing protein
MFNLLANPDERFFFKDRDSRFLLVSAGWLAAVGHGRSLDEVIGKTDFDIVGGAQALTAFEDEQRVIETGEPMVVRVERDWVPDRPDAWVSTAKLPLRDERGNIVGTWGIARDVTAQIDAEQALHASELQYRSLFEHNPQPMLAYDRETFQIIAVSNAAVAAYGYSREEFLSMTLNDLTPPEDAVRLATNLAAVSSRQRSGFAGALQWRHRYKDGTVTDVEITSDDLTLDGRECRIVLCLNVTERNRATAELAVARDQAVEASSMKSAFLANMSHEIRTPMNGVIGMNELLLDSELTDEQRAHAEQVDRSGELMLSLINDILDISKIESGQLELDVTDFPLRETIEQACDVAGLQAKARGLEFDLQLADEVPHRARGDGRRLRQVVLNLVSNAVKFTAEGSVVVHVGAKPQPHGGARIRVDVADTGIGIDPAALDRLFEPFTQADASTTRNYGGTGLGLAIARELIELMRGTIGCDSTPGCGSSFWFELEFAAPVATNGNSLQPGGAGIAAAPLWSTAPLVLVAEDSPVNQIVAVRALERCGCRVEVVADGRQALEALSTRRYDAVLMDCQMPDIDGYAATAELRRSENGQHRTPVIAMTAHAMDGAAKRCLEAGMDDYISKPMRREQLIDTLRRWIAPQTDTSVADDPPSNR